MAKQEARFINRELSWLEFNQRVLDEALDESVPLLERLNFLAITASNLDEFFMVRVGGLQMLRDRNVRKPDPAGLTPRAQLAAIAERAKKMVEAQYRCYREQLDPALRAAGIRRVTPAEVTPMQARVLDGIFEESVFPVVTPVAVTADSRFPSLTNLRLHVAVRIKSAEGDARYAIIAVGDGMKRFLALPAESGYAYMTMEDLIRMRIDRLFPGEQVLESVPFRLTRNADIRVREDMAADFMMEMENVLDQRREGHGVRLEIKSIASRTLSGFLRRRLQVRAENVYEVPGPMDLSAFGELTRVDGFDELRYAPWSPQPSADVDPGRSIFDEMGEHDILLNHPYERFDPVLRLIEEASRDPDVLAIKQTLYRTSSDSPVIHALMEAAHRGKYVTVIVELKARFDESRNIEWAHELEKAGAQVVYGVKKLKTHSKILMVVRREPGGIVRYLHFGTGNYNEKTARLYSDISYLTTDPDLGGDAAAFFHTVTGYSEPRRFVKLAAAPLGLREKILELIENEAERKRRGQRAQIRAKMNSLADPDVIEALYRASAAGVRIDLNVRGICCLRPGVPGLSENITVVSIVDRYLEHSRIFYFYQGGRRLLYIGSADMMPRNLDRRVELLVPVEDSRCRRKLIGILDTYFRDTVKARVLLADGSYTGRPAAGRRKPVRSQEALYRAACEGVAAARQARRKVFEPYRADGNSV